MRRWHSFIDIFQFPLKLLFIACTMISISSLALNSNAAVYFQIKNNLILQLAFLIRSIGNFIVINFPFFVLVKMMARKGSQAVQNEVGILGYIVFLITTMYFSPQGLPANSYISLFGLSVSTANIPGMVSGIQYPLQTGLFGALAVGGLARLVYHRSRSKSQYGFFSFIDKNSYAIVMILFLSFILGLVFSFVWPSLILLLGQVFQFIATDINNPMNLLVYGVLDRVLSVFNLGGLIRQGFWFSELGGSWIDLAGASYTGDVSVWAAQVARGTFPQGAGRFITPYYIINLFAIPGMLVALYTLFTDRIERKRYRLFFILAIVVSLLGGTLLPLELFLLIMAPLLFVLHITVTGCLFGLCQAMNISLGFSYSGNVIAAMPGNIFDLLIYVRNAAALTTLSSIFMVGLAVFVIYYLMTKLYYNVLAVDLFNTGMIKKKTDGFILAVGGLENIKRINSSLFRLTIQVQDPSLINFEQFQRLGASKVFEVRAGYAIQFGAGSTIVKNQVTRRMKEAKRVVE